MTKFVASLNAALGVMLEQDPKVVILGEDLVDPYGGAFKVTRGLSSRFPDRVLPTPISEAGFTGAALGLALRGYKPIVEIMFGDFATLCVDQLLNHAAKIGWYRDPAAPLSLVVRAPMGGGRGYGATHSQSLEKLFLGVPFLHTVAANLFTDPGALLRAAVSCGRPVLFIENKVHYPKPLATAAPELALFDSRSDGGPFPTTTLRVQGGGRAALTIVSYGATADACAEAARRLFLEDEVEAEVVIPTRLRPFDLAPIAASAATSGRLLVVEEGTEGFGWGPQVVASLAERGMPLAAVRCLGAAPGPLAASSSLESAQLPGAEAVAAAARAVLERKAGSPETVA